MKELRLETIEELACRPKVRRIAVENFLASMGTDATAARQNLNLDSRLYKWNPETIRAIKDGIKLAETGRLIS